MRDKLKAPHCRVTYIGHATTLIEMAGLRIITDPVLRDSLWHLRRRAPNPSDRLLNERPPDVVLLTHLHNDHTDLPSLRMLPQDIPIIAPVGSARYLRKRLKQRIVEITTGDELKVGALRVIATPAEHNGFSPPPRPNVPVLSYIIRGPIVFYFAGDTDLFDGMADIGREHRPDVALLPVSGFGPYVGRGHLTPRTAAQALRLLHPSVAIPVHWGTLSPAGPGWHRWSFLDDPPYAFLAHAAREAPETEVRILEPGQETVFPGCSVVAEEPHRTRHPRPRDGRRSR
ncbi:MAG TPA: MBL fold metallo-hydrolase [Caldilineae bacterium]|nr:MBL fold metallo-hydrolase [Caldilineae bacterium]